MELANSELPGGIALIGWLALVTLTSLALLRARNGFLPLSIQQHGWLAGMVCLGVLWSLPISIGEHVRLVMVGVPMYALMFGPQRALLGGVLALASLTLLTDRTWMSFGILGCTLVAVPAWVVHGVQRQLALALPRHLFVFLIGNGLFTTFCGAASAGLALLGLEHAFAAAPSGIDTGDLVGYTLLLAWGEALASGMIFSALVVFRPQLVMTYAQDVYLPRRPPL